MKRKLTTSDDEEASSSGGEEERPKGGNKVCVAHGSPSAGDAASGKEGNYCCFWLHIIAWDGTHGVVR